MYNVVPRPRRAAGCLRRLTGAVLLAVIGAWPASAVAQPAPLSSPLSLQQAVQFATTSDAAVEAAVARVAAGESGVDLARTAYYPRLDSSIQINRATRNNLAAVLLPGPSLPSLSGPAADVESSSMLWGTAAGFLVSWEAFDFGARSASVALARAQLSRATAAAALTRLDVGVRTAEAFLRLAAALETLKAARANVARQEVFARSVATLVSNQLRPGADESRAQAELAGARIQLVQAEQAEDVARAALARWLGIPPAQIEIASDPLLAGPPSAAPPPPASHPLTASQLAAIESSQASREALRRSYAPRISFQTAYSLRGSGATAAGAIRGGADGLEFDTANWAWGVTATLPVLDVFSVRERTRIEAHNERAERATYARLARELSVQTEQARAEMDGARRVADYTPIQLQAARVLEQQSRARYDAGLAAVTEVADSQRLLLQAEVSDALARLAIWRALLAAAAASGDLAILLK